MKTSLDFEGPADLSVGQIRISNHKGLVTEWMATPNQRSLKRERLEPGYYLAEISPAGVKSRSVVFEVREGEANSVSLPDFAALVASGRATNFLDVSDRQEALKSVYEISLDEALGDMGGQVQFVPDAAATDEGLDAGSAHWLPMADEASVAALGSFERSETLPTGSRLLSVGLAMERPGERESWDKFEGPCSAQLSRGRLALTIGAPEGWTPESGRRLRLSVAIESVRVERLLLPLYRGGTSVNIDPSPLSLSDVTLEVLPVDPSFRAIQRALEAGTREHAAAVRDHVLAIKGREPIAALDASDPWEALLAALLFLRFPEEFGSLSPAWTERLCERHAWAADSFIIRAQQLAMNAGDRPEDLAQSAEQAVDMLAAAHARGSPYFAPSNQFFGELAEALRGFDGLSEPARARVRRAYDRWLRELPLQRTAGVSFSWLSRDPDLVRERRILAPKRKVSGQLRARDTHVVFKGRISSGAIALEGVTSSAAAAAADEAVRMEAETDPSASRADSSAPSGCPALGREPGPRDDPNLGRFGGEPAKGGFTLGAQFAEINPNVVEIALAVKAEDETLLDIGDSVWFCLHPTFNPEWVRVNFRGRSAVLAVKAWGGFTVGVWLPTQGVELELNLAEIASAPRAIRER